MLVTEAKAAEEEGASASDVTLVAALDTALEVLPLDVAELVTWLPVEEDDDDDDDDEEDEEEAVLVAAVEMPTFERTHAAASSTKPRLLSKYEVWTLSSSPDAQAMSPERQYDRMTDEKMLRVSRFVPVRG